jgi:hypothetical protein
MPMITMTLNRLIPGLLLAVGLSVSTTASAQVSSVIDQAQDVEAGSALYWADRSVAQTFTAGMGMRLSHIELRMHTHQPRRIEPTTVEIRTTVDGAPSEEVLGSVFFPTGFSPSFPENWQIVDFFEQNIVLEEGLVYAVVLHNADPDYTDGQTNEIRVAWDVNVYPSGDLWKNDGEGWELFIIYSGGGDMGFRSYAFAIDVDVDPWSTQNRVDPVSAGLMSVAVPTTAVADGDPSDFDAVQLDPGTVRLWPGDAPNSTQPWIYDTDNDDDSDSVLGFNIAETELACEDTSIHVIGSTYANEPFVGIGTILTPACPTGCHRQP